MARQSNNPEQAIVVELRSTLDRLVSETEQRQLTPRRRRILESEIRVTIAELGSLLDKLDPIRQPTSMFDPANPKIVGRFVALALVAQDRHPLKELVEVYGSGVYAIYYKGENPMYAPISGTESPIYVGQAAPTTGHARTPLEQGAKLTTRLKEHRRNIERAASTLDINDFEFRMLVVQSGWETAAEDYLIHLFKPIWNNEMGILYGFGKHGDSATTRANKRSPWDTAHPGRGWAGSETLIDAKPLNQIQQEVRDHFVQDPIYTDLESVLESFIDELRQV